MSPTIAIDLGTQRLINGLIYTPVTSGTDGMIAKAIIEVSPDEADGPEPASGTSATLSMIPHPANTISTRPPTPNSCVSPPLPPPPAPRFRP